MAAPGKSVESSGGPLAYRNELCSSIKMVDQGVGIVDDEEHRKIMLSMSYKGVQSIASQLKLPANLKKEEIVTLVGLKRAGRWAALDIALEAMQNTRRLKRKAAMDGVSRSSRHSSTTTAEADSASTMGDCVDGSDLEEAEIDRDPKRRRSGEGALASVADSDVVPGASQGLGGASRAKQQSRRRPSSRAPSRLSTGSPWAQGSAGGGRTSGNKARKSAGHGYASMASPHSPADSFPLSPGPYRATPFSPGAGAGIGQHRASVPRPCGNQDPYSGAVGDRSNSMELSSGTQVSRPQELKRYRSATYTLPSWQQEQRVAAGDPGQEGFGRWRPRSETGPDSLPPDPSRLFDSIPQPPTAAATVLSASNHSLHYSSQSGRPSCHSFGMELANGAPFATLYSPSVDFGSHQFSVSQSDSFLANPLSIQPLYDAQRHFAEPHRVDPTVEFHGRSPSVLVDLLRPSADPLQGLEVLPLLPYWKPARTTSVSCYDAPLCPLESSVYIKCMKDSYPRQPTVDTRLGYVVCDPLVGGYLNTPSVLKHQQLQQQQFPLEPYPEYYPQATPAQAAEHSYSFITQDHSLVAPLSTNVPRDDHPAFRPVKSETRTLTASGSTWRDLRQQPQPQPPLRHQTRMLPEPLDMGHHFNPRQSQSRQPVAPQARRPQPPSTPQPVEWSRGSARGVHQQQRPPPALPPTRSVALPQQAPAQAVPTRRDSRLTKLRDTHQKREAEWRGRTWLSEKRVKLNTLQTIPAQVQGRPPYPQAPTPAVVRADPVLRKQTMLKRSQPTPMRQQAPPKKPELPFSEFRGQNNELSLPLIVNYLTSAEKQVAQPNIRPLLSNDSTIPSKDIQHAKVQRGSSVSALVLKENTWLAQETPLVAQEGHPGVGTLPSAIPPREPQVDTIQQSAMTLSPSLYGLPDPLLPIEVSEGSSAFSLGSELTELSNVCPMSLVNVDLPASAMATSDDILASIIPLTPAAPSSEVNLTSLEPHVEALGGPPVPPQDLSKSNSEYVSATQTDGTALTTDANLLNVAVVSCAEEVSVRALFAGGEFREVSKCELSQASSEPSNVPFPEVTSSTAVCVFEGTRQDTVEQTSNGSTLASKAEPTTESSIFQGADYPIQVKMETALSPTDDRVKDSAVVFEDASRATLLKENEDCACSPGPPELNNKLSSDVVCAPYFSQEIHKASNALKPTAKSPLSIDTTIPKPSQGSDKLGGDSEPSSEDTSSSNTTCKLSQESNKVSDDSEHPSEDTSSSNTTTTLSQKSDKVSVSEPSSENTSSGNTTAKLSHGSDTVSDDSEPSSENTNSSNTTSKLSQESDNASDHSKPSRRYSSSSNTVTSKLPQESDNSEPSGDDFSSSVTHKLSQGSNESIGDPQSSVEDPSHGDTTLPKLSDESGKASSDVNLCGGNTLHINAIPLKASQKGNKVSGGSEPSGTDDASSDATPLNPCQEKDQACGDSPKPSYESVKGSGELEPSSTILGNLSKESFKASTESEPSGEDNVSLSLTPPAVSEVSSKESINSKVSKSVPCSPIPLTLSRKPSSLDTVLYHSTPARNEESYQPPTGDNLHDVVDGNVSQMAVDHRPSSADTLPVSESNSDASGGEGLDHLSFSADTIPDDTSSHVDIDRRSSKVDTKPIRCLVPRACTKRGHSPYSRASDHQSYQSSTREYSSDPLSSRGDSCSSSNCQSLDDTSLFLSTPAQTFSSQNYPSTSGATDFPSGELRSTPPVSITYGVINLRKSKVGAKQPRHPAPVRCSPRQAVRISAPLRSMSLMHQQAKNIKACQNSDLGCDKILPPAQLSSHELLCQFKPVTCPGPGTPCLWQGVAKRLFSHVKEAHRSSIEVSGTDSQCTLFMTDVFKMKRVFFLKEISRKLFVIGVYLSEPNIYATIQYIASSRSGRPISATGTLEVLLNNGVTQQGGVWNGRVTPFQQSHTQLKDTSNCLEVAIDDLEGKEIANVTLHVNVQINHGVTSAQHETL